LRARARINLNGVDATALDISDQYAVFASGSSSGDVYVNNLNPRAATKNCAKSSEHTELITELLFLPHIQLLVSADENCKICFWRFFSSYLETLDLISSFNYGNSPLLCMVFQKKNSVLFTAHDNGELKKWCLKTLLRSCKSRKKSMNVELLIVDNLVFPEPELLQTVQAHASHITTLSLIEDNVLMTTGQDGILKLWNTENGELINQLGTKAAGDKEKIWNFQPNIEKNKEITSQGSNIVKKDEAKLSKMSKFFITGLDLPNFPHEKKEDIKKSYKSLPVSKSVPFLKRSKSFYTSPSIRCKNSLVVGRRKLKLKSRAQKIAAAQLEEVLLCRGRTGRSTNKKLKTSKSVPILRNNARIP